MELGIRGLHLIRNVHCFYSNEEKVAMEGLFTYVPVPEYPFRISYEDKIMSMGSCFSENMASYLAENKFLIFSNPFGILYNPQSIFQGLNRVLEQRAYEKSDLFFQNDIWHSFDHHSHFSSVDPDESLEKINTALKDAYLQLKSAKLFIMTWGTSKVFQEKESQRIVANCHKVPQQNFDTFSMSTKEIIRQFEEIYSKIKALNPDVQLLLSVSPIRHIRDGLHRSHLHKAPLLLAIDALEKKYPNIHYFPAYEIVFDELRDYRFYKRDMIHPSNQAVEIIWKRFSNAFFTENTIQTMAQVQKVVNAAAHKPFFPDSELHHAFIEKQLLAIEKLALQYPEMDFSKEITIFKQ